MLSDSLGGLQAKPDTVEMCRIQRLRCIPKFQRPHGTHVAKKNPNPETSLTSSKRLAGTEKCAEVIGINLHLRSVGSAHWSSAGRLVWEGSMNVIRDYAFKSKDCDNI